MINLTPIHKEAIDKARALHDQIDSMYKEIDDLITPIAKLAVHETDPAALRALADLLPCRFYQSELRTRAIMLERAPKQ